MNVSVADSVQYKPEAFQNRMGSNQWPLTDEAKQKAHFTRFNLCDIFILAIRYFYVNSHL